MISGPFVEKKFHIHLVSDSTGETLNALVNAALAQFENVDVQIHTYALVRSEGFARSWRDFVR